MSTKVFISWSGELSKKLAEAIRDWLPSVLQSVKPYFTPSDIAKGTRWESEIMGELKSSNIGIICLTKDNLNAPWILFEAGALSKYVSKSHICPLLFNLDSSDVSGPLAIFQDTKITKDDFRKLIKTINDCGGESKLDDSTLGIVFDKFWPDIEIKIRQILESHQKDIGTSDESELRTDREILNELLELTRLIAKNKGNPKYSRTNPFRGTLNPNQFLADSNVSLMDAVQWKQNQQRGGPRYDSSLITPEFREALRQFLENNGRLPRGSTDESSNNDNGTNQEQ